MNLEAANFTLRQAADAAGLSVNTVRTWFQRGHLTLGLTDKANEGEGLARHVSALSSISLGITVDLVNGFGLHPKAAATAANVFAHTGEDGRIFGLPFNRTDGDTFLCIFANGSSFVMFHKTGTDLIAEIKHNINWPGGFVLLPCLPVFDRVIGSLGFHSQQVIDQAYSGDAS